MKALDPQLLLSKMENSMEEEELMTDTQPFVLFYQ
jgi:hypothetical protein